MPLLGTVGIITLITQYQVQLFWLGLVFSFAGIIYLLNQIYKLKKIRGKSGRKKSDLESLELSALGQSVTFLPLCSIISLKRNNLYN